MHPDLNGGNGPTPQPRLLAGKYRDVESLEQGYTELQRVSNETYQKFQTLEERLGAMERMNPNERANGRRNPMEWLEELGVPGEPVVELVREELRNFMQPMIAAQEARQTVYREIPEFQEKENQVSGFLDANPTLKTRYQRMYQADPAGAMEWAFSTFDRLTGHADTVDDGRNDSRLPPSSSGQNRSVDSMVSDQEVERLVRQAQQTGDWSQVVAARLSIPDSHFAPYNPNQR